MQKLCFLFQLLLSTSYFWRNYVDHNFDFNDDDDEELTGMLHELGSTWIFGNGTGMLPNIPQGDLFEERGPRRLKSVIICSPGRSGRSYKRGRPKVFLRGAVSAAETQE